MRIPSSSQFDFARVPTVNIPRSKFDRSHNIKTTFDEGLLIPFYVDEIYPGDTFSGNLTAFVRLSTLEVPIMSNLYADVQFFYVPFRLLWDNFERMMGSQDNPDDSTDFIFPYMDAPDGTGFASESLYDYYRYPTLVDDFTINNTLFIRAYNFVWNQCYRDENLQDSVVVDKDDGPDDPADYVLLRRGKRPDYFTSALPWPQKVNDGSTLNVPLSGTAPVVPTSSTAFPTWKPSTGTPATFHMGANVGTATVIGDAGNFSATNTFQWSDSGLEADLSQASGVTINELREAFQVQRLFEKDARGGTRYIEIVKSHFGVDSPDARLQRPEYLGGHSTPIVINPVASTAATDTLPQGNLAAYGTALTRAGFTKSFVEHGMILGLVSVRADLDYQQGLPRMYSRSTRYDTYFPSFAHLGEQAILNKEIFLQGSDVVNPATGIAYDEEVFGYQERFAELRYMPSSITGQFRSNFPTTLDVWHLAQDFAALPTLNNDFIVENAPMSRILADENVVHFLFDGHMKLHCARPMPVRSYPGLIDHF